MKKQKKIFILLLIAPLFAISTFAQQKANANTTPPKLGDLVLTAKVKEGKVLLRWIPLNYNTWAKGIDGGYKVERTDAQGNKTTFDVVMPIVEPLSAFADTTQKVEGTDLAVALYKDGIKDQMPVDQLNQAYDLFMLSHLLNYDASKKAGVGLEDSQVEANQKLTYTVSLVSNPAIKASITVDAGVLTQYADIQNLQGTTQKKVVGLTWDEAAYGVDYPAYNIERSADGVFFEKINNAPYLNVYKGETSVCTSSDTIPKIDTLFYYRIRGIDYFTETSEPSNVIRVSAIPQLPAVKNLDGEQTQDGLAMIKWEFDPMFEKYVKHFKVTQSKQIDTLYTTAMDSLSVTSRSSVFKAESRAVYVRVHFFDIQGEEYMSAPHLVQLIDTIPPLAPLNLKGQISKEGLVKLDWDDSPEDDFLGYYVFAANDSLGNPTRITETYLTQSEFTDSVAVDNVMNKKMYYWVIAIDSRYNHSDYSLIAPVDRPDLIPPSKPNLIDFEIGEKRVTLSWINSTDFDVTKCSIKRRKENELEWTVLKEFQLADSLTIFSDTTVAPLTDYVYDIFVEDAAGNVSTAYVPFNIQSGEELIRVNFSEFTAEFDTEIEKIVLKWAADKLDAIKEFIIFREYEGEEYSIWQIVDADEMTISDDQIHVDKIHTYTIKARLKEGYISPTSKQTDIRL